MTPEGLAGFAWVFALWQDTVLTLTSATEPVLLAMSNSARPWIYAVGLCWTLLLAYRLGRDGLRGILAGLIIFFIVLYGFRPATLEIGGASVQMIEAQAIPMTIILTAQDGFADALANVLNEHTVAGELVPAQAAVDLQVNRAANKFRGTDLAALIQDYNASCTPQPGIFHGEYAKHHVEHLQAVGLMAGGALGIPAEEFSVMATAKKALMSLPGVKLLFGGDGEHRGFLERWTPAGRTVSVWRDLSGALDTVQVRERRGKGMEYLEAAAPVFIPHVQLDGRYAMPTQTHWQAVFAGEPSATPSYLTAADVSGVNITERGDTGVHFMPLSCLEAYRLAQAGAEEAYRALRAVSGTIHGGHAVSAETGALASAAAWQKFLSTSLQQTGSSRTTADAAAGVLSVVQGFKDLFTWMDMQTLVPMFVIGNAWLLWLTILVAPVVLILAPLRGLDVIAGWLSILGFCLLSLIFSYAIIISMSLVMAWVAIGQAGAAAGWAGDGADLDGLRGSMGILAGGAILLASWIASILTRVSPQALTGMLSSTVTATQVVSAAKDLSSAAMRISRVTSIAGKSDIGSRGGSPSPSTGPARSAQQRQTQAVTMSLKSIPGAAGSGSDSSRGRDLSRPPR